MGSQQEENVSVATTNSSINLEPSNLLPTRPADASGLKIAVGIFDSYHFIAQAGGAMFLDLKDLQTGSIRSFLLSANFTLDGQPCSSVKIFASHRFCAEFPSDIIPGKTYLAVLFWAAPTGLPSLGPASDTIVTINPSSTSR